jgi:hypothetical protein
MAKWSVTMGLLGVLVTGLIVVRLGRQSNWGSQQFWFLGLGALFPAWLVGFMDLLPSSTSQGLYTSLPPAALFSSSAALMGVILTEYIARRFRGLRFIRSPVGNWLLGMAALIPASAIALWNLF